MFHRWNRSLVGAAFLSGIVFLLILHYAYSQISPYDYANRDDGVITMSHARNLVDFGSIGVNPSGERVEGFSAPVQFFVFLLSYTLFGLSYETYAVWQTALASILVGAAWLLFFRERPWVGLVLGVLAAVLLIHDPSFLIWHGSGMENALTHVLFLLAAASLVTMLWSTDRMRLWLAVIATFMASITRIDSAYYIFPMLVLCVGITLFTHTPRSRREVVVFCAAVTGLWLVFNTLRWMYFGDVIPNTAYGQGKSGTERVRALLTLSRATFAESFPIAREIGQMHYGYLLAVSVPALYLVRSSRRTLHAGLVLLLWIALTYAYPFVFGPTRLDETRAATHVALFTVLLGALVLDALPKRVQRSAMPLAVVIGLGWSISRPIEVYHPCCAASEFFPFRDEMLAVQRDHDLVRPTIANADLGAMSWYKDFNIIDLGYLGSPVLSRIQGNRLLTNDYLLTVAAPDIIELHGLWSCVYSHLFEDSRFYEIYEPLREDREPWLDEHCAHAPNARKGLYVRKAIIRNSESPERRLIEQLRGDVSIDHLQRELDHCVKSQTWSCLYVTRTAYRFLPEFRARGLQDGVVQLFNSSPSALYDQALLASNARGDWYADATRFLQEPYVAVFDPAHLVAEQAGIQIFLRDNMLGYKKEHCTKQDQQDWFFVHIVPNVVTDLPEARQVHGFDNADFLFPMYGFNRDHACYAVRPLPDYPFTSIRTGQYKIQTNEGIWSVDITISRT